MKLITAILIQILLTSTVVFSKDCFPEKEISRSPKNKYTIIWQEPNDNETHHLLFDNGFNKYQFIDFTRSACVCWEPSGEYFSVTSKNGSNISESYIYSSNGPKILYNILSLIPEPLKKQYNENFHHYIEVNSWTDDGLFVHLWGYGDNNPSGFDIYLICTKNRTGFNCIKKKG